MFILSKKNVFLSLIISNFYFSFSFAQNTNPLSVPLEVGGSNYPMYDANRYLASPRPEDHWFEKGYLKLVIGSYHENPSKIKSQLKGMYDNGQRKIALVLWHEHFPKHRPQIIYGNRIRSNKSKLPHQQEKNLINILKEINSIGYDEVTLRFAPQGSSNARKWSIWNETLFQESWNFLYNTVNTMEKTLKNSPIKRAYDLALEHGGIMEGFEGQYIKSIWSNFKAVFPSLSAGFSIAYAPNRLDQLIKLLKETHHLPEEYWLDIYGSSDNELGPAQALKKVKEELTKHGETNKRIVIFETYYNDEQQYSEIIKAASENNLKLRYIMQWPFKRHSSTSHLSVNSPLMYRHYLKPFVYSAGSGCSDYNCIWVLGQNFDINTAYVDIRHPQTGLLLSSYKGSDLIHSISNNLGKHVITLRLKSAYEKSLFSTQGLRIYIVNPTYFKWSDGTLVRK